MWHPYQGWKEHLSASLVLLRLDGSQRHWPRWRPPAGPRHSWTAEHLGKFYERLTFQQISRHVNCQLTVNICQHISAHQTSYRTLHLNTFIKPCRNMTLDPCHSWKLLWRVGGVCLEMTAGPPGSTCHEEEGRVGQSRTESKGSNSRHLETSRDISRHLETSVTDCSQALLLSNRKKATWPTQPFDLSSQISWASWTKSKFSTIIVVAKDRQPNFSIQRSRIDPVEGLSVLALSSVSILQLFHSFSYCTGLHVFYMVSICFLSFALVLKSAFSALVNCTLVASLIWSMGLPHPVFIPWSAAVKSSHVLWLWSHCLGTWVPMGTSKLCEIHKIHMIKLEKGIENDNCRFGLKLSGT